MRTVEYTTNAYRRELDKGNTNRDDEIRLRAMKERDIRESNGRGDQLMEMQEILPPLARMKKPGFKIDVCFEYDEPTGPVLQWCQGVVMKVNKYNEKLKFLIVDIAWNEDCLKPNDDRTTVEKLMMNKWNPETHQTGSWREDLHDMAISADD